jgi:hypothetical protein
MLPNGGDALKSASYRTSQMQSMANLLWSITPAQRVAESCFSHRALPNKRLPATQLAHWVESMWQGLWRTVNRQRLPNIFWCPRRCISTIYLDPALRGFTSNLVRKQPVFELPPSSIQILAEPSQFYKTLLVSIIQNHLWSYITFCRTWSNELKAEFSYRRSTLAHQSLSLFVNFIYFFPPQIDGSTTR